MTAEVFISYSSADEQSARRVREKLKDADIDSWFAPLDILSGSWPKEIVEAVRDCKAALLILSERSNASEEVYREIALAAHYRKQLVVFKIEDVKKIAGDLEYFLRNRQMTDGFTGGLEIHLDDLVRATRDALQWPPLPAACGQPPSRLLLGAIALGYICVLTIAVWAQRMTDLGYLSYGLFIVAVLLPFALLALVPDLWKPLVNVRLRSFFSRPGKWARSGFLGTAAVLFVAAACTAMLGSLLVITEDTTARWICVGAEPCLDGTRKLASPGQPARFVREAKWFSHRDVIVNAELLPSVEIRLSVWKPTILKAPEGFFPTPLLLIRPDPQIRSLAGDGLSVEIRRGDRKELYAELPLSEDGRTMDPFWIGCQQTKVGLLGSSQQSYPCRARKLLSCGETLWLITKDGSVVKRRFDPVVLAKSQQELMVTTLPQN
jgi:hypothetical protein